jgi:hypothetical protein
MVRLHSNNYSQYNMSRDSIEISDIEYSKGLDQTSFSKPSYLQLFRLLTGYFLLGNIIFQMFRHGFLTYFGNMKYLLGLTNFMVFLYFMIASSGKKRTVEFWNFTRAFNFAITVLQITGLVSFWWLGVNPAEDNKLMQGSWWSKSLVLSDSIFPTTAIIVETFWNRHDFKVKHMISPVLLILGYIMTISIFGAFASKKEAVY